MINLSNTPPGITAKQIIDEVLAKERDHYMTINSKRKGKIGELEAAAALRHIGIYAKRGRQYKGTDDSPDVATLIDGIHIEVKRTERLQLYKAMDQANDECGDKIPLVMHRQNRREWLVCLRLNDLPYLAEELASQRPTDTV